MIINIFRISIIILIFGFFYLFSIESGSGKLIIYDFDNNLMDSINKNNIECLVIVIKQNQNLPEWLKYCNKVNTIDFVNNNKNVKKFDISVLSKLDLEILVFFSFNGIDVNDTNSIILPNLRILRIDSCNLYRIPSWIKRIKNLKYLEVHNDKLSKIPSFLALMPNLIELRITRTLIKYLPIEIFKKSNLSSLILDYNYRLNLKSLFKNIKNKSLRTLSLINCKINKLPKEIKYLSQVEHLYLDYNFISSLPKEITSLKELIYLTLNSNEFTNFPEIITKMNNLEFLEIDSNNIESIPTELIKGMKNIKKISLIGNPISIQERERILKELPKIQFYFTR
jgi:Leucine-rich repeat (LRR) protein